MITRRCALVIGGLVSLATLSCAAPTEPHPDAVRFAALLSAPAWTLGASRDSTFASELEEFRLNSGFAQFGFRVARSSARWTALWDTVSRFSAHAPIAADFSGEMVVLVVHGRMPGNYNNEVRILHVTRQRDTLFVLARVDENNCEVLDDFASPLDARVVPRTTEVTWFLIERRLVNCRTGEYTPIW